MQLAITSPDNTTTAASPVTLPQRVDHVFVPPIKCQGIKTKLVPFILSSVKWDGRGRWIEPFIGSGVVLFNLAPPRAYVADTNKHIITLHRAIASGAITASDVKDYLLREGSILVRRGDEYYYEVRNRFNRNPSSLDFLFLNRSCFNGVMRFNRKGEFNVPFGHKIDRFRQAYITKITNQVARLTSVMRGKDWTFAVADWRETVAQAREGDFIYADPPYAGRHTDYYSAWTEGEASELMERLLTSPAGFALSTWSRNKYRDNPALRSAIPGTLIRTTRHFYHVGPSEDLRNEMEEALVIRDQSTAHGETAAGE